MAAAAQSPPHAPKRRKTAGGYQSVGQRVIDKLNGKPPKSASAKGKKEEKKQKKAKAKPRKVSKVSLIVTGIGHYCAAQGDPMYISTMEHHVDAADLRRRWDENKTEYRAEFEHALEHGWAVIPNVFSPDEVKEVPLTLVFDADICAVDLRHDGPRGRAVAWRPQTRSRAAKAAQPAWKQHSAVRYAPAHAVSGTCEMWSTSHSILAGSRAHTPACDPRLPAVARPEGCLVQLRRVQHG